MHDGRRRMAAAILAAAVSVGAVAQVRHAQTELTRDPGVLSVFGAEQPGAAPLRRLDGALRGIPGAGPPGSVPTAAFLRNLNPALHVRVAAPSLTPEVLVDVIVGSDPAGLQRTLESLGMRNVAHA
jgi:hypothetical protein